MGAVTIEEFLGLKPKMLLSNATEYKKAKCVNKNVAAKISHNEYKNVLLNVNKNVLAKKVTMNIKMFCWINSWDIQWVELKVKLIE